MRSLYWKIFISFWLATILIIFTTAWFIGEIAHKSSIPIREQVFMDSYANAAVATFESGQQDALLQWLKQIGISRHMRLYLLTSTGSIIAGQKPPDLVKKVSKAMMDNKLSDGIFKTGNLIVSHEILSTTGTFYRLAAATDKPISFFVQIPWAGLSIRLFLAIFISGLICYWLSRYLTQPLRYLGMAAKSIGTGKLNTRVGHIRGHNKDEIANLSHEFDRMAEQLEVLVQSKERLLQDISHELRSPLARLNIAIELARTKTKQLACSELNRMEMECIRLNVLISEILEFARLEKSTAEIHKEPIDLLVLLKKIIKDAQYEFQHEGKTIALTSPKHCTIQGDERLLHRAFENVVRNALHYSPSHQSIHITVTQKTPLHEVLMTIEDMGPGVPTNQLDKIFSPFYRVDLSREKKTGGFGLGLAIASRAITLHQGQIEAKNRAEGGLLISINLPE